MAHNVQIVFFTNTLSEDDATWFQENPAEKVRFRPLCEGDVEGFHVEKTNYLAIFRPDSDAPYKKTLIQLPEEMFDGLSRMLQPLPSETRNGKADQGFAAASGRSR